MKKARKASKGKPQAKAIKNDDLKNVSGGLLDKTSSTYLKVKL
jgi:hypothetical protein